MSRRTILVIYILVDLAIAAGAIWCGFHHIPVSKYLIPAFVLFTINGIWLLIMAVRKTPPRSS